VIEGAVKKRRYIAFGVRLMEQLVFRRRVKTIYLSTPEKDRYFRGRIGGLGPNKTGFWTLKKETREENTVGGIG